MEPGRFCSLCVQYFAIFFAKNGTSVSMKHRLKFMEIKKDAPCPDG